MDENQPNPTMEPDGRSAPDPALLKLVESGQGMSVSAVNTAIIRAEMVKLIRSLTDCQNELENLADEQRNKQRSFLMKLLEVADSLDRLITPVESTNELANSLQVLRTQLWQILGDEGIVPIELRVGQPFDPALCEISQKVVRLELAPNTITSIDRRGYTWQSKPFRRARVAISTRPAA